MLEVWGKGDAYEFYVGRWSRVVAAEYLAWLGVPRDRSWLDLGCGTGALSQSVLAQCEPGRLIGVDRSEGFLREADRTTRDERANFAVADGAAVPVASMAIDVAVSGLMLNFTPKPAQVIAEMRRVVKPGGRVSAYVWDYAGRLEFMRVFWDAAAALKPEAADLDEGRRFPLCQADALGGLFRDCGLTGVEVRAVDISTTFRDFDDYWSPFLGGQGPAPTYAASLAERDRAELRERIRRVLVPGGDGPIQLTARAWAVRGTN